MIVSTFRPWLCSSSNQSFRMVTITSPKTLLTDNGDVVAVEELLSTLDLFKKLERQTIDLHSVSLPGGILSPETHRMLLTGATRMALEVGVHSESLAHYDRHLR